MEKIYSRLLLALVLLPLFVASVNAGVLANGQLVTPTIPDADTSISIHVPPSFDPNKPVWAIYQLVAISAQSEPVGEVVLDSSFEGVLTPIVDSVVIFKADDLKVDKSAGTLGDQLKALVGERSPEELKAIFGEDMYAAYEALNKKEGAYLTGAITKTYHPGGKKDLVLLTSMERTKGIQPVLISVVIGQGEIPAQYQNAAGNSLAKDKLVAAIIAFFLLLFFWFIKRR